MVDIWRGSDRGEDKQWDISQGREKGSGVSGDILRVRIPVHAVLPGEFEFATFFTHGLSKEEEYKWATEPQKNGEMTVKKPEYLKEEEMQKRCAGLRETYLESVSQPKESLRHLLLLSWYANIKEAAKEELRGLAESDSLEARNMLAKDLRNIDLDVASFVVTLLLLDKDKKVRKYAKEAQAAIRDRFVYQELAHNVLNRVTALGLVIRIEKYLERRAAEMEMPLCVRSAELREREKQQIEIGYEICDLLRRKLLEIEKVLWEKDIIEGGVSYRSEDILYSTFEKIGRLNAQVKEYLREIEKYAGYICGDDAVKDIMSSMHEAVREIEEMPRKINECIRFNPQDFAVVEIGAFMQEAIALNRQNDIVYNCQLDEPSYVRVPGNFQDVIAHFFQNARQESATRIAVVLAEEGKRVRITISDNGKGIEAKYIAFVFAPFFSTSRSYLGSNTLFCTERAVRAAGGDIRVESAPGRGTTFTIELPYASSPLSAYPTGISAKGAVGVLHRPLVSRASSAELVTASPLAQSSSASPLNYKEDRIGTKGLPDELTINVIHMLQLLPWIKHEIAKAVRQIRIILGVTINDIAWGLPESLKDKGKSLIANLEEFSDFIIDIDFAEADETKFDLTKKLFQEAPIRVGELKTAFKSFRNDVWPLNLSRATTYAWVDYVNERVDRSLSIFSKELEDTLAIFIVQDDYTEININALIKERIKFMYSYYNLYVYAEKHYDYRYNYRKFMPEVKEDIHPDLLYIKGLPHQIVQLLDLLLIRVFDSTEDREGALIEIKASLDAEKRDVAILIKDNGVIVRDRLQEAICKYVSSELRETNVSLDIIDYLVRRQGGAIEIKYEPDKGTIYTIRIPVSLPFHESVRLSGNHIDDNGASPLAFRQVKHARDIFRNGIVVVDFGCGGPSWGLGIIGEYGIRRYIGIEDNPQLVKESNSFISSSFPGVAGLITIVQGNYLIPLPSLKEKADIVTLHTPKVNPSYLNLLESGEVTAAMYQVLRPNGLAIIFAESYFYDQNDEPRLDSQSRPYFRKALEQTFGPNNVIEFEDAPVGYMFTERNYFPLQMMYVKEEQKVFFMAHKPQLAEIGKPAASPLVQRQFYQSSLYKSKEYKNHLNEKLGSSPLQFHRLFKKESIPKKIHISYFDLNNSRLRREADFVSLCKYFAPLLINIMNDIFKGWKLSFILYPPLSYYISLFISKILTSFGVLALATRDLAKFVDNNSAIREELIRQCVRDIRESAKTIEVLQVGNEDGRESVIYPLKPTLVVPKAVSFSWRGGIYVYLKEPRLKRLLVPVFCPLPAWISPLNTWRPLKDIVREKMLLWIRKSMEPSLPTPEPATHFLPHIVKAQKMSFVVGSGIVQFDHSGADDLTSYKNSASPLGQIRSLEEAREYMKQWRGLKKEESNPGEEMYAYRISGNAIKPHKLWIARAGGLIIYEVFCARDKAVGPLYALSVASPLLGHKYAERQPYLSGTGKVVLAGFGKLFQAHIAIGITEVEVGGLNILLHCGRVAEIEEYLAEKLRLAEGERKLLRAAALLHDWGKCCTAEFLRRVNYPGVTPEEILNDVKGNHVGYSLEIYDRQTNINMDGFSVGERLAVRELIACHHMPGSVKEELKLLAQILAVADWIEAYLSSSRGYRILARSIRDIADIPSELRKYAREKNFKLDRRLSCAAKSIIKEKIELLSEIHSHHPVAVADIIKSWFWRSDAADYLEAFSRHARSTDDQEQLKNFIRVMIEVEKISILSVDEFKAALGVVLPLAYSRTDGAEIRQLVENILKGNVACPEDLDSHWLAVVDKSLADKGTTSSSLTKPAGAPPLSECGRILTPRNFLSGISRPDLLPGLKDELTQAAKDLNESGSANLGFVMAYAFRIMNLGRPEENTPIINNWHQLEEFVRYLNREIFIPAQQLFLIYLSESSQIRILSGRIQSNSWECYRYFDETLSIATVEWVEGQNVAVTWPPYGFIDYRNANDFASIIYKMAMDLPLCPGDPVYSSLCRIREYIKAVSLERHAFCQEIGILMQYRNTLQRLKDFTFAGILFRKNPFFSGKDSVLSAILRLDSKLMEFYRENYSLPLISGIAECAAQLGGIISSMEFYMFEKNDPERAYLVFLSFIVGQMFQLIKQTVLTQKKVLSEPEFSPAKLFSLCLKQAIGINLATEEPLVAVIEEKALFECIETEGEYPAEGAYKLLSEVYREFFRSYEARLALIRCISASTLASAAMRIFTLILTLGFFGQGCLNSQHNSKVLPIGQQAPIVPDYQKPSRKDIDFLERYLIPSQDCFVGPEEIFLNTYCIFNRLPFGKIGRAVHIGQGYFLTNHHVAAKPGASWVGKERENNRYAFRVVATDRLSDLCLLKVANFPLQSGIPLSRAALKEGDTVVMFRGNHATFFYSERGKILNYDQALNWLTDNIDKKLHPLGRVLGPKNQVFASLKVVFGDSGTPIFRKSPEGFECIGIAFAAYWNKDRVLRYASLFKDFEPQHIAYVMTPKPILNLIKQYLGYLRSPCRIPTSSIALPGIAGRSASPLAVLYISKIEIWELFQELKEFFYGYARVLNNTLQRPAVNLFVVGNNQGNLFIWMEELNVAATLACFYKPFPQECMDNLISGKQGRLHIARLRTLWDESGRISFGLGSKYNNIASFIFLRVSFSFLPWLWQPGKEGTLATIYPSSPFSRTILIFIVIPSRDEYTIFEPQSQGYSDNAGASPLAPKNRTVPASQAKPMIISRELLESAYYGGINEKRNAAHKILAELQDFIGRIVDAFIIENPELAQQEEHLVSVAMCGTEPQETGSGQGGLLKLIGDLKPERNTSFMFFARQAIIAALTQEKQNQAQAQEYAERDRALYPLVFRTCPYTIKDMLEYSASPLSQKHPAPSKRNYEFRLLLRTVLSAGFSLYALLGMAMLATKTAHYLAGTGIALAGLSGTVYWGKKLLNLWKVDKNQKTDQNGHWDDGDGGTMSSPLEKQPSGFSTGNTLEREDQAPWGASPVNDIARQFWQRIAAREGDEVNLLDEAERILGELIQQGIEQDLINPNKRTIKAILNATLLQDIRLIVADYDGTLCWARKPIIAMPQACAEIIFLLSLMNFAVATGHTKESLEAIFSRFLPPVNKERLHFLAEVGSCFYHHDANGDVIFDDKSSRIIDEKAKRQLEALIRQALEDEGLAEYLDSGDLEIRNKRSAFSIWFKQSELRIHMRDLAERIRRKAKKLNKYLRAQGARLHIAVSCHAIDISITDKYSAVKGLMEKLKIMANQVAVFGDSPNDLSMFWLALEGALVFCADKKGFIELDAHPELNEKLIFIDGPMQVTSILRFIRVVKESRDKINDSAKNIKELFLSVSSPANKIWTSSSVNMITREDILRLRHRILYDNEGNRYNVGVTLPSR